MLLAHDEVASVTEGLAAIVAVLRGAHSVGFVPHVNRGDCQVAHQIDLFFIGGAGRRRGVLLDEIEFALAHDSLTNVDSVHVTPVADVSEPKIQVVALQADPVTNSLHFARFLGSNIWLIQRISLLLLQLFSLILDFTANLRILFNSGLEILKTRQLVFSNWALIENLILTLNAHLL